MTLVVFILFDDGYSTYFTFSKKFFIITDCERDLILKSFINLYLPDCEVFQALFSNWVMLKF